jgi:hypothetical protein
MAAPAKSKKVLEAAISTAKPSGSTQEEAVAVAQSYRQVAEDPEASNSLKCQALLVAETMQPGTPVEQSRRDAVMRGAIGLARANV